MKEQSSNDHQAKPGVADTLVRQTGKLRRCLAIGSGTDGGQQTFYDDNQRNRCEDFTYHQLQTVSLLVATGTIKVSKELRIRLDQQHVVFPTKSGFVSIQASVETIELRVLAVG